MIIKIIKGQSFKLWKAGAAMSIEEDETQACGIGSMLLKKNRTENVCFPVCVVYLYTVHSHLWVHTISSWSQRSESSSGWNQTLRGILQTAASCVTYSHRFWMTASNLQPISVYISVSPSLFSWFLFEAIPFGCLTKKQHGTIDPSWNTWQLRRCHFLLLPQCYTTMCCLGI